MKRMKVMKTKLACSILAIILAVGLFPTQVQATEIENSAETETPVEAGSTPEVIATVDGMEITTEHMYGDTLDLDMAGISITDANMEVIIEGFLKWAVKDADTSTDTQDIPYILIFFFGDGERNNDLKMTVNETAAEYLELLQSKGRNFQINMGTENGGIIIYSGIEGATTIGFATHDYLDNTHWDFYGSGFDLKLIDFPYNKPGAVQFLYQTGNGTMNKKDISDTYSADGSEITVYDPLHISYPGLHFLVPKDTTTAENTITIPTAATQEELKNVLTSSASTLEGEVKATLGAAENQVVDASLFSQVATRKDAVTSLTLEHNNITYEIASADINKPTVSMTLGAAENTDAVKQIVATAEYAIDFAHSGDLPGSTKVTIPVTGVTDGDYFWSYLNSSNQLVESQPVKVTGGKVQAILTHCSTYVLTKEAPATGGGESTGGGTGDNSGSTGGETGSNSGTNTGSGSSSSGTSTGSSSKESVALTNVPQTGDSFPMELLLAAALICGVSFVYAKKKETN